MQFNEWIGNCNKVYKTKETFTEDKNNKEFEEIKKKEKEILDQIESYEKKQSELEDILERDTKTLNSKF
jgi:hypothetical protein